MFQQRLAKLRDDPLLKRVVRNSSYLFSSSAVSAVLNVAQGVFVTRLLGDSGYGLLAILMDFPSSVNRLLSFRMSEVVVKYVGEALAQQKKQYAAALVKGIGLTEALTSVLAYLVLFLLSNLVYETSTGVLQVTNQFKQVAHANFYQSVGTTLLIVAAVIVSVFFFDLGIFGILTAYLVGKTI